MLHRRHWLQSLAGLAGLALGAGAPGALVADTGPRAGAAGRLGGTRLVVGLDHKTALANLPLTVADRLGYFQAEGLDVELREFADAGAAAQAAQSRAVHVLAAPYSQTWWLGARGQPFTAFVVHGRAPQVVMGVSLKTVPHYRGLDDLRGRRVAVQSLGGAAFRVARLLTDRAGLGEGEVEFVVPSNSFAAVQGFRNGQFDAISFPDPTVMQLEQLGEVRVVADTRTLRGTADVFGGPMPSGCLCAPADFVDQYPRWCQALADAVVHALKWLQTAGPSDLIKTVPESHFQGDRALYLAAFERSREAFNPDGLMPDGGPGVMLRVMAQLGEPLPPQPAAALPQTFTNTFARRAKQRFRA